MKDYPLVSIIIRTCGRPAVLKKAIESVKKQTYTNFEIVIVEDGGTGAEEIVLCECANVRYQYLHTEKRSGRTVIGNMGMNAAKGDFLNFLDDDDILLPNHIEVLVEHILTNNVLVAYAIAEEHQIKQCDKEGVFTVKRKIIRYAQPYNRLLLCYMNYFPIQSIMFHRSLYEKCGGFDERIDVLEDWDMWLRYSVVCKFHYIPQITSIYYTPYKSNRKRERDISMKKAEVEIAKKNSTLNICMNAEEIYYEMDYILNRFTKKGIAFYLKKARDFLLYKDI